MERQSHDRLASCIASYESAISAITQTEIIRSAHKKPRALRRVCRPGVAEEEDCYAAWTTTPHAA